MIVLELVPQLLAKAITEAVDVPTIGIGAGPHVSGQVLVSHDLLGLFEGAPRFSKRYMKGEELFSQALAEYCAEVRLRLLGAFELRCRASPCGRPACGSGPVEPGWHSCPRSPLDSVCRISVMPACVAWHRCGPARFLHQSTTTARPQIRPCQSARPRRTVRLPVARALPA